MTDEELVGEVLNGKPRIWRFTAEEPEHPIYIYGHSRFERWIVQLTVQLPAYILLLWMAFIAYILARNFANGMVDWKVAAVIAVLIGLGCFIARLGLVDLPKPFEAYDREGALYVKRGKELFRVVGIRDEYSVLMKTAFNKVPLLRLTCYCLKLDTSKGRRIVSFLSEGERHKFRSLVSRYVQSACQCQEKVVQQEVRPSVA